jgi:hypothetical protein
MFAIVAGDSKIPQLTQVPPQDTQTHLSGSHPQRLPTFPRLSKTPQEKKDKMDSLCLNWFVTESLYPPLNTIPIELNKHELSSGTIRCCMIPAPPGRSTVVSFPAGATGVDAEVKELLERVLTVDFVGADTGGLGCDCDRG